MNQAVVHGSHMVAAGSPNWWSATNMSTPPRHQHHSLLALPPPHPHSYFPHQSNDIQEFPESWSQLLLGSEQVDEEGSKSSTGTKQMQSKTMEKYYEEQLMNQIISNNYSCFADFKQDQNLENYGAGDSKPFNFWAHQMVSASSPKSCVTTTDLSDGMLDFSHKSSEWKIVNPRDYADPLSECNNTARGGANKKARIQPTSSQTTFKARKETLRDKITAIHQLVSPFGKTDTASVLLEAIGYISFLQNQIEALSQPYLGSGSRNLRNQLPLESDKKEANKDLRSRGLCLVPVSCTFHLGRDNAADYWAPSPFAANIR